MTEPHVGMKLFWFDENHRVYKKTPDGRSFGPPIWKEHWVSCWIIGETSKSWIVARDPNLTVKMGKKVPKRDFPPEEYVLTEEDIERAWVVKNRHELARIINYQCRDHDVLVQIMALLQPWMKNQ